MSTVFLVGQSPSLPYMEVGACAGHAGARSVRAQPDAVDDRGDAGASVQRRGRAT